MPADLPVCEIRITQDIAAIAAIDIGITYVGLANAYIVCVGLSPPRAPAR